MLKDVLLFRENPSLCIGLFDTDEIATHCCIGVSVLSDNAVYSLRVFLSVVISIIKVNVRIAVGQLSIV